jgi:hypothetical protein
MARPAHRPRGSAYARSRSRLPTDVKVGSAHAPGLWRKGELQTIAAGRARQMVRRHRPQRVLLNRQHVFGDHPISPLPRRGSPVELLIGQSDQRADKACPFGKPFGHEAFHRGGRHPRLVARLLDLYLVSSAPPPSVAERLQGLAAARETSRGSRCSGRGPSRPPPSRLRAARDARTVLRRRPGPRGAERRGPPEPP